MRALSAALSLIFVVIFGFADEPPPEEGLVLSTPEEVGSQNTSFLIRGLISPLSGNLSLRQTDLIVRGAQEIRLERIYTPPRIPSPLHDKEKHRKSWDEHYLYKHLSKNHKGWQFFPHLRLQVYTRDRIVRVCDGNGMTLDFQITKTGTRLISDSFGMSNVAGDTPGGKYDPRNTKIFIEEDGSKIEVRSPDGSSRIYRYKGEGDQQANFCYLEKEVLPNGKILKYHFQNSQLNYVESLSPNESVVYASLRLEGLPSGGECKFTSSSHDTATYAYENRHIDIEVREKLKKGQYREKISNHFPPILKHVGSPFYRNESLSYSDRFLLDHYEGKEEFFQCQYKVFGPRGSRHYKLEKLLFPIGSEGSFQDVCSVDYSPAAPGVKEGITTVKNADGTKTIYRFTKNLLTKVVETYDTNGSLKLQKPFSWTEKGWLASVEILDGEGNLFSKKSYEYDTFGNPILETITGDLTGSENSESYAIKREYSQEGRNLLLREENEESKVTLFDYLPKTNLLTAKFTQNQNQILIREFYVYDKWNNLVQKIVDDGQNNNLNDLYGVTQRTWTQITLRKEAPFIHMPEWMEEKYLENGEEKLAKRTHITYDRWGNIAQEDVYDSKGEFSYSIYKTYNERGNLLSETNALGQERTFAYDSKGRPIHSINYSSRLHKAKIYDPKGRLIQEDQLGVDGSKKEFSYDYDANDDLVKKVDEYKNPTQYMYDPITHKPITCDFPKALSTEKKPLSVTTHFAYDPLGREITKIDPNGNTTHFKYNARGDKTQILYPNGSKETYHYYKNGKCKKHVNQEGLAIFYEYDVLGRVITKKYYSDEQIAEEAFAYNALHLLSVIDKEGNLTKYSYDGLGRKIAKDFCGRVVAYRYDALGRLQTTVQNNGGNTLLTSFKRDLLDRITSKNKTDILGNLLYKISYSYDEDGNQKTITRYINNEPNTEFFTHDSFGRITEQKDALGFITRVTYDDQYLNPISQKVLQKTITDPKGTQIVKTYDSFKRVVKQEVLNPNGNTLASKELSFDPCGNLLLEKDHIYKNTEYQKTQAICYRYNPSNLLESFTRGCGTYNERTTFYTYTPSGKIASKTLPNEIQLHYGYHPLGFGTSLSSSDGTIDYRFERNLLGNLLWASDQVSNIKIEREIDSFGNVLSEAFSTGLSIEKSYDAFNRPLSVKIANQGQVDYSYDPLYLRGVARISPSGTLQYSHKYKTYDHDGNLHQEELIGECGSIVHQTDPKGRKAALLSPYLRQIISYDACDNLISIEEDDQPFAFAYDGLDQLVAETRPHHNSSYAYDSNYNRVEKDKEHIELNELDELQSLGSISCDYDLNGNLITKKTPKGTTHFTYDALNQLVEAKNENRTIKFTYDPLSRRLSKVVQEQTSFGRSETWKEFYLWDGREEIGAFAESGSCNNLKILGTGYPVVIELGEKPFAPIIDVQGNIHHLINLVAKSQEISYNFTAFGEGNPSVLNPWGYASKRWDPELGLSYFGKRYYDPQLAKWLTLDPSGFVDGTNLYQYALNNPFRYQDPEGENLVGFCLGIGQILAGGALIASGTVIEIATFGGYTICFGIQAQAGAALITSGLAMSTYHAKDISFDTRSTSSVIWKNTDVYVPDRPLPANEHGEPIPDTDSSHTQLGTRNGSKGKYPKAREFDSQGKPVRDIEFTDHGRPHDHPNPHQHRREDNSTGGTKSKEDAEPLPEWKD
ncbi:MAG: putative deoxyribonuclease RhsC [Chlamydiae bacterium]|nr:putative deoxyribonuclease RhsC [Chlamydiota bacterium]